MITAGHSPNYSCRSRNRGAAGIDRVTLVEVEEYGIARLLDDGSKKQIQDVEVGDEAQATDPESGETTSEPVLATISSKGDKNLVQITVDPSMPARFRAVADTPAPIVATVAEGNKLSKSGVLISTETHPFWVAGDINAWLKAADLKLGMWLRTSAGTYVQITATEHKTAHDQRVHNLAVADLHTYYVEAGDTPILVHNCDPEEFGSRLAQSVSKMKQGKTAAIIDAINAKGLSQPDAAIAADRAAQAFGGTAGQHTGLNAFSDVETESDEWVGEVVACPAGGFGDVGEAEQA